MERSECIKVVAGFLTGKRREKFLASIAVLDESLKLGSWIARGSIKADSGFYQGLVSKRPDYAGSTYEFESCLRYGRPYKGEMPPNVGAVVQAWVQLCNLRAEEVKMLNEARPRPVVTAIGLSPKVTKTLQECNLDVDVSTVRPADIKYYEVPLRDDAGNPIVRNGVPVMVKVYYVAWSEGIKHGKSRFYTGCEACGKHIPSRRFVPLEMKCRRNGLVSMWVGCDCAKNIFGVKDIGLERDTKNS